MRAEAEPKFFAARGIPELGDYLVVFRKGEGGAHLLDADAGVRGGRRQCLTRAAPSASSRPDSP